MKNEILDAVFIKQVRLISFMQCGCIQQTITVTEKYLRDKRHVDYVRKECTI